MSARSNVLASSFVILCGLGGGLFAWPEPGQPTRLTFLSVGQGDCTVFQTAGHTILIDAGPNVRGSDAGKRIVVPDLRRMGIECIDLVLLSHPDMDHIGGLGAILRSMPVGTVGISASFKSDHELLSHLAEMGCAADEIRWLGTDQAARIGSFSVEIACPKWFEGEQDNDGSEFVRIAGSKGSAVFTGDASSITESVMLRDHDWTSQILHVGHHGSYTASSDAWLSAVHPQWAVISCGRSNMYGHPHPSVLRRLEKHGIKVARTDRDGDITFELGPRGWERKESVLH